MKKTYTILFILSSFIVYPQYNFNITYAGNYTPGLRNIILFQNNNYIGLGFDQYQNKHHILIINFDSIGDTIWTKHYGDTIHDYYHGSRNSLIENFSGGYSIAGSRFDSVNKTCMLMKFDDNFDTLWTKYYFDNPDFTALYNHVQTDDGGYALVGSNDEDDPDGDVLLIKTDSLGNMEWYRKYGTGAYDFASSIVITNDNGFLIGGSSEGYGGKDAILIKTDSLGNEQWTRNYGHPTNRDGSLFDIEVTMDSGYVVLFGQNIYTLSGTWNYYKSRFIKFDKSYNVLWDKQFGTTSQHTGPSSIIESLDGSLLITVKNNGVSGLLKLNSNGDSIWQHNYTPPTTTGQNALLAIKQTNDEGFIMAGVAYSPQQAWVVKTDSCGCLVTGCGCGGTGKTQMSDNNSFTIYPNPAKDRIHINTGKNSYNAIILDIYGRIVKDIETINDKAIDVSFLDPGVYIIKIGAESYKFVKN